MKKENDRDEMRGEYDFTKLRSLGRGVYFERYWRSKGARLLQPGMAEKFPDDESLHRALEEYLRQRNESA